MSERLSDVTGMELFDDTTTSLYKNWNNNMDNTSITSKTPGQHTETPIVTLSKWEISMDYCQNASCKTGRDKSQFPRGGGWWPGTTKSLTCL
eukprot:5354485-Amphidinium_carterae.1